MKVIFLYYKITIKIPCQHDASPESKLISNEYDKYVYTYNYDYVDVSSWWVINENVYEDFCREHELKWEELFSLTAIDKFSEN